MAFAAGRELVVIPRSRERQATEAVVLFAKVQIATLVFLQKFAIPAGAGGEIQLVLPVFIVGLILLLTRGAVLVDLLRLVGFLIFSVLAIASQMMAFQFSITSLGIVIVLYATMVFRARIDRVAYLEIMRFFVGCVAVMSMLAIFQVATQYTVGIGFWVNLDALMPKAMLFSNYNYMQPLSYLSPYYKPNAVFILEASFISQFCGIALILEALFFRRIVVCGVIASALLLSLSGTGLMILAFCAPLVVAQLSGRMAVAAASVGSIGMVVAGLVGWFDTIGRRMDEFTSQGTSGYARFAVPISLFLQQLGDPAFLLTGNGAGATAKGDAYLLLPFAKLVSEYGILTFVGFYTFLLIALFRGAANLTMAFTMFVFFNIAGSTLALPMCVLLIVLLSTLYEVPEQDRAVGKMT